MMEPERSHGQELESIRSHGQRIRSTIPRQVGLGYMKIP